jgi:hypothetical protein
MHAYIYGYVYKTYLEYEAVDVGDGSLSHGHGTRDMQSLLMAKRLGGSAWRDAWGESAAPYAHTQ